VTFRLRPLAEADIEGIALHIAKDSPKAARNWLEAVLGRFRNLALMPRMGAPRFDIRPDLRLLPMGDHLILYREIDGGVEIVRVLHGARQWQELL
jgi:toxin ParE1/3/4